MKKKKPKQQQQQKKTGEVPGIAQHRAMITGCFYLKNMNVYIHKAVSFQAWIYPYSHAMPYRLFMMDLSTVVLKEIQKMLCISTHKISL